MLDSGASCNFISADLVATLGLSKFITDSKSSVRLANGGMVNTLGVVELRIRFGRFRYVAPFYVLQCAVPLILGMQFFSTVRPNIDWGSRKVSVNFGKREYQLESSPVGNTRVQAVVQQETSNSNVFSNSFDGLDVSEKELPDSALDSCEVKHDEQQQCTSGKVLEKHCCRQCSRVLTPGNTNLVCQKCANASFSHQQNNLVAEDGLRMPVAKFDSCSTKQVPRGKCADVSHGSTVENNVEVVPLKQFIRGGKRHQYLNFGIVQLDEILDDKVQQQLNFTHRTAHGGNGDVDGVHGNLQQLADEQLQQLKSKYPSVFSEPQYPVDRSDCPVQFEHSIPLIDEAAPPPKRKLYPLDSVELAELKQQIQQFLESNRIEPSNGAYGAPILFAKKKDGGLRMCIDYRMLNQQTQQDMFPLPRIDELLQRLDGSVIFSKLDLRDGYHQIRMKESDKVKTSFSCRYGTFQFTVMPFGLSTAPSTFQRMMNRVFFELLDEGVLCYLDDLLIYSRSVAEHKVILDKVFALLQKHKLYIKESKCHLFLERVNFLGHVVDRHGLSLESGKVDAVAKWPQPENVNQVQQFLGLCNYYRRFVLRFSELAGPLTLLTRKDQPFTFGEQQKLAFQKLKDSLCNAPVLKVFDPKLDTRVVCDASNFCVGAVLEQMHNNKWHPVEYYSKRLSQAERNYSATDREFVAIKLSLERWRQFLIGKKFVLLTDHAALTYLQSTATVSRRNARWLDFLSQFNFEIFHIKGRENVVADSLSRIPGTEVLQSLHLCSMQFTLGVEHLNDVPVKLQQFGSSQQLFCNSVLTINENETFLKQIRSEQQGSSNSWFISKRDIARTGSTEWQFRDGILCRLVNDHFCPVIPSSDSSSITVILHDLHSSALSGHLGFKKLLKIAQSRFYWQQMYKSVEKFCKSCSVCQANKSSTQKPVGKLQPVENPSQPFQHVTMDFIMSLPTSVRGYDAIFTIVDRFSRLVRFIPCHSTVSAQDVACLFFEHWVCRFGMPQKIISDRDTRFSSKFWQSLMKQLDCRVAMSTAYHPQTDGLSERYHRSVEQILRCYCSQNQSAWCQYLSQCEFALNASIQESTGCCPFQTVFGTMPPLPIDTTLSQLQHPSVVDFVSKRTQIQNQVQQNLEVSKLRMKTTADLHRRPSTFNLGQSVWLSTANLPLSVGSRKLSSKWAGPFKITAIIAPEAYQLALPSSWKIHPTFHSSQLKVVHGSPQKTEPMLTDQADDEFEVEKILGDRTVRRRRFFLIKWKGYDNFENSWEPESALGNCKELLQQYMQSKASSSGE